MTYPNPNVVSDLTAQLHAMREEHGAETILKALANVFAIEAEAYAPDVSASWLAAHWHTLNAHRSQVLNNLADNRSLIK